MKIECESLQGRHRCAYLAHDHPEPAVLHQIRLSKSETARTTFVVQFIPDVADDDHSRLPGEGVDVGWWESFRVKKAHEPRTKRISENTTWRSIAWFDPAAKNLNRKGRKVRKGRTNRNTSSSL